MEQKIKIMTICSVCLKITQDGVLKDGRVSHGLCAEHAAQMLKDIENYQPKGKQCKSATKTLPS